MQVVLDNIKEEVLENVFKRHNRLIREHLAQFRQWNCKWLPGIVRQKVPRAVFIPEEIYGAKLVKNVLDYFGINIADGQDQWRGKVVRIAHLDYVDTFDIIIAISALELEMVLKGLLQKFSCAKA